MDPLECTREPADAPRWALPLVLALAAGLRLLMLRYGHGTTLESDEAIFGLMGIHTL